MQVTKDLLCTLWNTIYITTTPVIQVRRATMGRSGIRFGELEAESRGWRAVKSQITCHAARTGLRRNILLTELLTCFNTWDYQSKQCQIVQTSHNMIGFFRHDIGLICSVLPQSKNNLEKQLAKTMQNGHRSMQKKQSGCRFQNCTTSVFESLLRAFLFEMHQNISSTGCTSRFVSVL